MLEGMNEETNEKLYTDSLDGEDPLCLSFIIAFRIFTVQKLRNQQNIILLYTLIMYFMKITVVKNAIAQCCDYMYILSMGLLLLSMGTQMKGPFKIKWSPVLNGGSIW